MQQISRPPPISFFQLPAKSHPLAPRPLANDIIEPDERATADEKNIVRIHLQEFLLRMFAAALRGHASHRAFNNLQQRLLYTFARNIASYRRII